MNVFVVNVEYSSGRLVSKIERGITKHGEIVSQTYLNTPYRNWYWTPFNATYIVITKKPRVLKITLSQMKKTHELQIPSKRDRWSQNMGASCRQTVLDFYNCKVHP